MPVVVASRVNKKGVLVGDGISEEMHKKVLASSGEILAGKACFLYIDLSGVGIYYHEHN